MQENDLRKGSVTRVEVRFPVAGRRTVRSRTEADELLVRVDA